MPIPLQQPAISDEVMLARYPFLPQAGPWIADLAQQQGVDLEQLLEGEMMEDARQRARVRLVQMVESDEGLDLQSSRDIHTLGGRVSEAFSFYYARLVICALENERSISRWAQAEAERAEKIMIDDPVGLPIIAQTFISKIKEPESGSTDWSIGMADFIELCPKITGERWRLANSEIEGGWVRLYEEGNYSSRAKLARLLRERIKSSITIDAYEKMSSVTDELAIRLAEPVAIVSKLLASRVKETVALSSTQEEDWPPCMRHAIEQLAGGVNVNHHGRVFLAAMSSTLGLPLEAAVEFFQGAPDFSPETTSYQLNHIYQGEYTPAACASIKINHNCPVSPGQDRLCDQQWMNHPLKYVRAKHRRRSAQESLENTESKPYSAQD